MYVLYIQYKCKSKNNTMYALYILYDRKSKDNTIPHYCVYSQGQGVKPFPLIQILGGVSDKRVMVGIGYQVVARKECSLDKVITHLIPNN